MKGALLDRELKALLTVRRPTPRGDGPDAVVDGIAATLRTLSTWRAVSGVGSFEPTGALSP